MYTKCRHEVKKNDNKQKSTVTSSLPVDDTSSSVGGETRRYDIRQPNSLRSRSTDERPTPCSLSSALDATYK